MKLKKVLAVVLSTMMVAGMAVTGAAADASLPIGSVGYASCYVYCGNSSAGADTDVYSDVYVDSIDAYVDVTFTAAHEITGYEITVGSDSDSVSDIGTNAYASVYISDNLDGFVGSEAESYHEGYISGYNPVKTTITDYN